MHSSPNKCFAACFLLKSWIQNFLELLFWISWSWGRGLKRERVELRLSGSLSQEQAQSCWFQGSLLQGALGRSESQPVRALPILASPHWPPRVWRDFRVLYFFGLAKLGAPCSPGSPFPVGYSQSCPWDTGMQAGKGEGSSQLSEALA